MPLARVMLDHMGIKNIGIEDYEADDIIGTLAKELMKIQTGMQQL